MITFHASFPPINGSAELWCSCVQRLAPLIIVTEERLKMARDDEELPPSYEDVIREDLKGSQGAGSGGSVPQMPPRPSSGAPPPRPARPSRPSAGSSAQSSASSRPPMSPRPSAPTPGGSASTPQSRLPWVYPKGYYCSKCGNTGYKIKNGRSCKRCWRKFAPITPAQNVEVVYQDAHQPWLPGAPYQAYSPYGTPLAPPMAAPIRPGAAPMMLRPGDPRIGGVVCGECRGRGMIRFFLDDKICPLCHGVGRIRVWKRWSNSSHCHTMIICFIATHTLKAVDMWNKLARDLNILWFLSFTHESLGNRKIFFFN